MIEGWLFLSSVEIMDSTEILEKLVGFPTVSKDSNLELIEYVEQLLGTKDIKTTRVYNQDRTKTNLLIKVGPPELPGVLLSGHSDVVPVEEQDWSVPPFELTSTQDRLYGRGTTDMKAFIACALATIMKARDRSLHTPLWLAISYDEEVGCIGVRRLLDMMAGSTIKPLFCIVGEPTMLKVANGHKGKVFLRANCHGRGGHSALAPKALNALHLACDFIDRLRVKQQDLANSGKQDDSYEIPYTTIHTAKIEGGVALNIVPAISSVDFEMRHLPEDNPSFILEELQEEADKIAESYREHFSEASIAIEQISGYPGLTTPEQAPVVDFVKSLTGTNDTFKVAFGTEGGLFQDRLGVPTVVCGPGSMEQGHKADEFIAREQISRCDQMLAKLLDRLEVGII